LRVAHAARSAWAWALHPVRTTRKLLPEGLCKRALRALFRLARGVSETGPLPGRLGAAMRLLRRVVRRARGLAFALAIRIRHPVNSYYAALYGLPDGRLKKVLVGGSCRLHNAAARLLCYARDPINFYLLTLYRLPDGSWLRKKLARYSIPVIEMLPLCRHFRHHPHQPFASIALRLPHGWLRRTLLRFPRRARTVEALQRVADGRDVWVFPAPSCPWGYLFQRPHQMARALARLGKTVIYCVDHGCRLAPDAYVRGLHEVEPNLFLFDDGCRWSTIGEIRKPVQVWQYWPHQAAFVRELNSGSRVLYDVVDHVGVFQPYSGLLRDYSRSLRTADTVTITARSLLGDVARERADALLVPNAVCFEEFAQPKRVEWPDLERVRERFETVVTYYGALADWVDFGLVRECARRLASWAFVMVGVGYAGVLERVRPTMPPNVFIWPPVPYGHLPWLLHRSDVAVVPFKVNEITLNVSPVKLFEYMAAGKPVVTTDLPECRQFEPVAVARDAEDFLAQLRLARERSRSPESVARLQACAAAHTWTARAQAVLEAMGR